MQAFIIIFNLIPQTLSHHGETFYNDGKIILSILETADGGLSPLMQQSYLLLLAPYMNGKDPHSILSPASQRLMTYAHLRFSGHLDHREREDLFRKFVAELAKGELSAEEELLVLDALITDAVVTAIPKQNPTLTNGRAGRCCSDLTSKP